MTKLPYVAPELVEYLERIFPDQCPEPTAEMRDVWVASGAISVVRKLRAILEEQTKQQLTGR